MALTIKSYGTLAVSGASGVTADFGSPGVTVGELLIVEVYCYNGGGGAPTVTPSTGGGYWTQLGAASTGSILDVTVWWRIADGTESTANNRKFTFGGTQAGGIANGYSVSGHGVNNGRRPVAVSAFSTTSGNLTLDLTAPVVDSHQDQDGLWLAGMYSGASTFVSRFGWTYDATLGYASSDYTGNTNAFGFMYVRTYQATAAADISQFNPNGSTTQRAAVVSSIPCNLSRSQVML